MIFFQKNKENILNSFIFCLMFLIIFSYLFPLWYSFFISEIFIFVNAWDEETYLTYQGAIGGLTSPGYQISSMLTLIFQELNISGSIQNLISDTIVVTLTLYFVYKIFVIYKFTKIDSLAFSSLILFSSVLFNQANPIIQSMFLREINTFMVGYESYLSILRTPEPQLSYLFLSIFLFLFFKTKKKIFLIIPLFITYFYVAIVYLYCLIIYFFISKLKLNFKTILFANIFAYFLISIGLIIMDKFFLQRTEIINYSAYVSNHDIIFPIILFVNLLYSCFIYLIFYLKKDEIQKQLFLMSLLTLFIIFFVSNFQILTGYMLSYKNYFDYGLSIIIGISTIIFFLSLYNIKGKIIFIFPLISILYLSLKSNGFDFEKINYKIWTGYQISDNDKELILNKSESSIILELNLNSKISYSKAKSIAPLFSYQYTFPFINRQCPNIEKLHLQAYEQYKNNFPNNIENIEYLEKRYNIYLDKINQRMKDMKRNHDDYKGYCNRFDTSVKFNFIEVLPGSSFSYVGIGQ